MLKEVFYDSLKITKFKLQEVGWKTTPAWLGGKSRFFLNKSF